MEKRKGEGTFLLEGSDTPISISLTEVGRYVDDRLANDRRRTNKLSPYDPVIIHKDSGERRPVRFLTAISPYIPRIIYDGETAETSVILGMIGPAE